MSRLIDADALEEEGWSLHRTVRVDWHTYEYQVKPIAKVPTIYPVRKGRWIEKPNVHGVAYCSLCDYELHTNDTNYCPNCGTKMEKGEKDG